MAVTSSFYVTALAMPQSEALPRQQVTTGPDGPRANVVGSCPLGDASWVTPLYHLVVVLCERDGTLVVVHPGREFQVSSGPFSSGQWRAFCAAVDPTGRLMAVAVTPQARSNSSTYPSHRPTVPKRSSISGKGCMFFLPRPVADVKRVLPMLTR